MSILASSTHGGHQMSLIGFVLFAIVGMFAVLRISRAFARVRKQQAAGAGDSTASNSPVVSADPVPYQSAVESRQTPRSSNGPASSVVAVLVALGVVAFALYGIVTGAQTAWASHSGVSAQVLITECQKRSSSGFDTCAAQWQQPDGTQKALTVQGYDIPVHNTVDVHVHGDQAYTQSPYDFTGILWGLALLITVPALWFYARRRRSRQPR